MWYKMSWYENSARVPMIIHHPSKFAPKRVTESVSTMDLLPTFVDLAGGDPSVVLPLDGSSLYDYLVSDRPGKDEVFGEYMGEGTVTPVMMIRRGKWKYTTSLVDPPQLFDLVEDPDELADLAKSSKPEHKEAFAAFMAEAAQKWDFEKIHMEVLASQRQRRLCFEALQIGMFHRITKSITSHANLESGRKETWDYQPPYNDKDRFIRSHIPLDELERRARYPVVDYLGRTFTAHASHHGVAGAIGE
jgi:hypothetical protein